ncbi:MFS general substrate transporter [Penicillium verhagenii]|uniref:MFS general substrate transporter n=1 Tax=Penicillium verhagenii TaxID=1562060 RepID=UPI00254554A7|nr:MFS general substrate transporter [Penicillium verhagenii]KAJ5921218.1 MFS general substrate transporter [Penicillium verhagenii]
MTVQDQEASEEEQIAFQDERRTEYRMDGGLQAWLQVLGSWILFANTWGLTNSFGVFETFYTENLLATSSASAISWIGSIQLFLTMLVGVFAGWFLDAGYLQALLITGTFLEVFGIFMTSLCTTYWQVLLAQGICVGLGSGLLGLTSVAVIPLYFSKRRMVALGIAATGSSLAGIIYPIMMRRLFVTFTLMMASVYVPFFYIQKYALQLNIEDDMAFYLLSMMNATSLIGRIGPNLLAD